MGYSLGTVAVDTSRTKLAGPATTSCLKAEACSGFTWNRILAVGRQATPHCLLAFGQLSGGM